MKNQCTGRDAKEVGNDDVKTESDEPKAKFLNFERRKIEFLDEFLVKKHDFGMNFGVLASKI